MTTNYFTELGEVVAYVGKALLPNDVLAVSSMISGIDHIIVMELGTKGMDTVSNKVADRVTVKSNQAVFTVFVNEDAIGSSDRAEEVIALLQRVI